MVSSFLGLTASAMLFHVKIIFFASNLKSM